MQDPEKTTELRPEPPAPVAEPGHAIHLYDAAAVAALTIATWVLCALFNVTETLRRLTAPYERYQLDELPIVLLVLGIGLTWFAMRRHTEARTEIARRKSTQARLATALAENRRLARQYVALQEAERKALARELHDELGQYLNVIKLDAVGIRDNRRDDAEAIRARAGAIVEHCNHIHSALATLVRELRPPGLDELGLPAALEHCVQIWRARMPTLTLQLHICGEFDGLAEDLAVTVFRLVQEALTNIAKHAAAQRAEIRVTRGAPNTAGIDLVEITIADDGSGRKPSRANPGLGLIGMRERVESLHGTLEVTSAPGLGFSLRASIPVAMHSGTTS